ncbi:MAG: hypothetical protein IEMM0008_0943 [bacterium]|nr:MAG: hypothetical protein IEMM0008_0943 [bacterium]
MFRGLWALVFVGVIVLTFGIYDSYGKPRRVKHVKVNKCVEVWMEKDVHGREIDWIVYAGNRCYEPRTIGRQLKITLARNVTASKGSILDIKRFIISKRSRKIVFTVSRRNPKKSSALSWRLIR